MIFSYLLNMQSHPSWVCGLKHHLVGIHPCDVLSHPSWVCGLKQHDIEDKFLESWSHPSWVCGLKLHINRYGHISWRHTLRGCVD